ncbi:MAG: hypothetical protein L3J46_01325 [Kangiellaceae bacterium]|nr:hypothetical protein [Kangiellaceae bacterium]
MGTLLSSAQKLNVNLSKQEITVTYNASEFGINSWIDSKIYITTWGLVGEGDYRPLTDEPSRWSFSSSKMTDAYILDEIKPLLIIENN